MIDWQQIDTVLLDMDGTLLDLAFDNGFWHDYLPTQYALAQQRPLAEAAPLLTEQLNQQRGQLNWYCIDYWSATLSLDILALKQRFHHQQRAQGQTGSACPVRYRPQALAFLAYLRAQGKLIVLVTNAHPRVYHFKSQITKLHRHIDRCISSHEIGWAKEQAEFWPRLQQTLAYDPARTLFIDDSAAVLHCARQHGLSHIYAIAQPDTRQPSLALEGFASIAQFQPLMGTLLDE